MEWLTTILAILVGILLRLAVPIAITAGGVLLLKWLDERWKRDAGEVRTLASLAKNIGCWEMKRCPPERRARCTAYAHPDIPCWQVLRDKDGRLQERCLGCEIFRRSPIPTLA